MGYLQHGRRHLPGGTDPIPGLSSGSGDYVFLDEVELDADGVIDLSAISQDYRHLMIFGQAADATTGEGKLSMWFNDADHSGIYTSGHARLISDGGGPLDWDDIEFVNESDYFFLQWIRGNGPTGANNQDWVDVLESDGIYNLDGTAVFNSFEVRIPYYKRATSKSLFWSIMGATLTDGSGETPIFVERYTWVTGAATWMDKAAVSKVSFGGEGGLGGNDLLAGSIVSLYGVR